MKDIFLIFNIKPSILLLIFTFSFLNIYGLQGQIIFREMEKNNDYNFYKIVEAYEELFQDVPDGQRRGWKQFKRWEWLWEPRVDENGNFPDYSKALDEWKAYNEKSHKQNSTLSNEWTRLGPFDEPRISGRQYGGIGRVNVLRPDPDNSSILWAGSASGGVWKSTDMGETWQTFPFTEFMSLGVSDIAISPSNRDIVYVATGDANGASSLSPNSIGLIKTTNGGKTWQNTNLEFYLSQQKVLSRVLVDPVDSDILIVATWDGIFKSTDGGETWDNNQPGGQFMDMEFHPANPDIIYASTRSWSGTNSIFKSEDQGESWEQVQSVSSSVRIALSVSLIEPDNVYAIVASTNRSFHSFLFSSDAGETWTVQSRYTSNTPDILSNDDGFQNRGNGQGEYDLAIAANPFIANIVYVGGINIWKSEDYGQTWELITHWYGGHNKAFVHADIHDLVFDLGLGYLYAAHDGGIDMKNPSADDNWTEISKSLDITQFYHISVSQQDDTMIIAGSQDNGTHVLKNGEWVNLYGGDGMDCEIDPLNSNRIYWSTYYGNLYRSSNGGSGKGPMLSYSETRERGAWVTPFAVHPQQPNIIVAGYINVWKSTNYGKDFTKISSFSGGSSLRSIAIAPSNPDYIYAALYNRLSATTNGGASWESITPPGVARISSIIVHPDEPGHIWISNNGFSQGSKVWEYKDGNWRNISGNLPNIPVSDLVYQKNSPDRIYAATDVGVFMSDYNSAYWQIHGSGLPNVMVTDLEINENAGMLRAGTYGRGIWETELNDCNLPAPQVNVIGETRFCQGDSVILELVGEYDSFEWSNGETTKRIAVYESGDYSIMTTGEGGCVARSEAITVEVIPVRDIEIRAIRGFPVCEGEAVEVDLTATLGFTSYEWSNGETNRSITVNELGTYTVTGFTNEGCKSYSEEFVIEMNPNPAKPVISRYSGTELIAPEAFDYQWYFEGESIPGAKDRILEISELGNYSVEVFNEAGCGAISEPYNVISDVSEIYEGGMMSLSPNPSDGLFRLMINSDKAENFKIEVSNVIGHVIKSDYAEVLPGGINKTIDLRAFPNGIYYVSVETGKGRVVLKAIKE